MPAVETERLVTYLNIINNELNYIRLDVQINKIEDMSDPWA